MYIKFFFILFLTALSVFAKDPPQIVIGNPNAQKEVVIYTALTCGACAKFHQNILTKFPHSLEKPSPQKKHWMIEWVKSFFWEHKTKHQENKKELDYRIVIRHYPLDAHSLQGAIAVECAPENEKVKFYEQIFSQQDQLIQRGENIAGFFKDIADRLKIELDFAKRESVKKEILEDFQKVQDLVDVTPTFFVGYKDQPLAKRRKGSGELSPELFSEFLEGK